MIKKLLLLLPLLCMMVVTGCEELLPDLRGDIKGVVKDVNGDFVKDCLITITPTGVTKTSGVDGTFEFARMEAGEYTITVKKEGYISVEKKVTVHAGKLVNVDFVLDYAFGSIIGTVRDKDTNQFIENCLISITPGSSTITTGSNGGYEFKDLARGEYTLTFVKTGYPNKSETVKVVEGKATHFDVMMGLTNPVTLSETELDFGDFETTKTLTIFNNSDGDCSFEVSNVPVWISLSLTNGGIAKQSRTTIVATANRDMIDYGKYNQNLIIKYSGRVNGEAIIKASIEKVLLTVPEVEIAQSAENVTETSFDIKGNIVATGGSQILDYGHCWSTNENPTTNDNCTRYGQRDELGTFVSSISDLTVSTTYYVRAYARNAQGISYSEQIIVTTQDPYNDKWDGNIASGYAGGSGKSYDPYIIKTGGQLLYALKQGTGYLKLANDIDLNNHNWKPFDFSGTLDGDGHTIFNLYMDRPEEACGLIRSLSGTVQNLTICGVNINAKIGGVISSTCGYDYGTITNCHVILTQNSTFRCSDYAGGITGSSGDISNCSVKSTDNNAAFIAAGSCVGGIVGELPRSISGCTVSCDIYGESYIGGICGYLKGSMIYSRTINNCLYQGKIRGTSSLGGIVGFTVGSYGGEKFMSINSCKVVAEIEGSDYIGGICGYLKDGPISCECNYTEGTITASANATGISGFCGYIKYTSFVSYFSYSTMSCDHKAFVPISGSKTDCFSIYDTDDIVKKMKETYSDYAKYWNFDNTWTWTGTVNGQQKSVKCPRLAWE